MAADQQEPEGTDVTQARGLRWWPCAAVLVSLGIAIAAIWLAWEPDTRQDQVLATQSAVILAALGVVIWLVLLSRLAGGTRLKILILLVLGFLAFTALFRFEGVTGDLVPVLRFRWSRIDRVITGQELSADAVVADFPQFLGPDRDGTVAGVRLARDWSNTPPRLIWRRPVGKAWSAFAVAGERAVTLEQRGEQERVVCYDLVTGHEVWAHADEVHYTNGLAGDGPRSTPTISNGRVFTFGATGILNALDLLSGRRLWRHDVLGEEGGQVPTWGVSCSPLVDGGRVVVNAGGQGGHSVAAYDVVSGAVVWRSGSDASGYSSPLLATLAGRRQVVSFGHSSVASYDAADGTLLWSHGWSSRQPNVSQPLPVGNDRLLVSSGYGVGSALLEIGAGRDGTLSAAVVWRSRRLKSKFANMILNGAQVYGLDDGILTCLDVMDGRRRWKAGRYGHGQLLKVDDLLLVMAENGEIVLVALDPSEHRELTRFQVIDGKVWNPPALAGSRLLVRNDEQAALFELPLADG